VSWHSGTQKYQAQVKVTGTGKPKRMHLGYFATAEEAARAYARAYLRQHGRPPTNSLYLVDSNLEELQAAAPPTLASDCIYHETNEVL